MKPQYTSDLTDSENETIVQDILTYLQSHQEVPSDLLLDIRQKFSKSDTQPTPPKLDIFNIDKLLVDPSFSQTMDDHDTIDPNISTMTTTKKVRFDDSPEFIINTHMKTRLKSTTI